MKQKSDMEQAVQDFDKLTAEQKMGILRNIVMFVPPRMGTAKMDQEMKELWLEEVAKHGSSHSK